MPTQHEKCHHQPPLDQNRDLLQDQVEARNRVRESWKNIWVSDPISSVYKTKKILQNSPGQINIKAEPNKVSCPNLLRSATKAEVGCPDGRCVPKLVSFQHQSQAVAGEGRTRRQL